MLRLCLVVSCCVCVSLRSCLILVWWLDGDCFCGFWGGVSWWFLCWVYCDICLIVVTLTFDLRISGCCTTGGFADLGCSFLV